MTVQQPLAASHVDWPKLLPNPPLLSSFQSGWSSIQLTHFRHPAFDVPEISSSQHIVLIPGSQSVDWELVSDGRWQKVSYRETDFTSGCIDIFPADLPVSLRSRSTGKVMEVTLCFLEPTFLA